MVRPKILKNGDAVALVALASPPEMPHLVDFAVDFIKSLGLVPKLGDSCRAVYGYLAGDDELRANDINWAFEDKEIAGIFSLRGGYGIQRILDKVNYVVAKANPKPFFGYSDVTALHTVFNQRCQFITYHTPMLATPGFVRADGYTLDKFAKLIFSEGPQVLNNPYGHEWEFLVEGSAIGRLCGGNLAIIASSLGTDFEIDTHGKILFIEEVEEEPYKIDRMLNQLRLAGKFNDCAGVIFGDFADCLPKDPERSLTIPEIIENLRLPVPVLNNFRCGHCYPTASLPMGAFLRMNSHANILEVLE
ncbi:MAG: LD-carboxypeptidase [Defluviitaleaceae bacterium]|nr:LD-carboxypeptidase [Defluviitaleaceae bacterium]